jgi:Cu2+-exporting ATPase
MQSVPRIDAAEAERASPRDSRAVERRAALKSELCFHCSEPVPGDARWRLHLDGAERAFCCAGCLGVAQTIRAAGLDDFYARRTAHAAPQAQERDEWSQYDVAAEDSALVTRAGDRREISLLVEGTRCAACVWLIEEYVRRLAGVSEFGINYATRRARLVWSASQTQLSSVLRAIAAIGYRAYPYDPKRREALARREGRTLLTRTAVALLAMMQVMMFSVPGYVSSDGVDPAYARLLDWASLVLTLPAVVYCAAPFFGGALRNLLSRRLGMDVPVALGVGAAFAASAWATMTGSHAVYFDSVTMFIALLLVARYVEFRASERAGAAIETIARDRPHIAQRLTSYPASDEIECVVASRLIAGDVVQVAAGASVPADGDVLAGRSSVEEALLNGESWPRAKAPGSRVLAGSVNRESPLLVRVTAAGESTAAAALSRLVLRAAEARPRIARTADRAAGWFVSALLVIAAGTALAWTALEPSRVLSVTFAVLAVSCPCALSLATPAALAAAAGALGRRGILAVRPDALETLSRVTHLVIDKTGTLTSGCVRLTSVEPNGRFDRDEALSIAASLEQGSTHPIATAVLRAGARSTRADDVIAVPGQGVEGVIEGRRYRFGRPAWVGGLHDSPPPRGDGEATTDIRVALGDASGWLAWFSFGDALREGAAELILTARAMGIAVSLVSGDRRETVDHMARLAGITRCVSDAAPEDKRTFIAERQREGHVVAMIGDGINDAPSLAQADVSLALVNAAALTQWTADIVVASEDLNDVGLALTAARRTFGVIRQNLAWALAYNAIAIPLAATGYLHPLAAALGMSASSILVVANAWRLSRLTSVQTKRVVAGLRPTVVERGAREWKSSTC